ncbi:unnamed protein product [Arctia plantaginis]|uniref:Uncharacterized protein n=1 Tax=Arctia plantaginis TaxID=874455 RepID=A0A8S0ZZR1_ARCPL|nr:unnamed protein product [Arctia plantaginis]
MLAQEKPEDIVDSIAKKILEYAKTNSKPKSRRSNDMDLVQPAIVHFEDKRPSVMLKMDTTSLVDVLADALKSKTVQSYVQHYSRKAAEAFNVVKQKLDEVDGMNKQ